MRSHKAVTATALVAALALLLLQPAARAQSEEESAPKTALVGVVNVNTATPEQLELLPGVGPARARAIIEHRKEHGPFAEVEDLRQISGIGEKALERIRPHCTLRGKTTARLVR